MEIQAVITFVIEKAPDDVAASCGHALGILQVLDSDGMRLAFVESEADARSEIEFIMREAGLDATLRESK